MLKLHLQQFAETPATPETPNTPETPSAGSKNADVPNTPEAAKEHMIPKSRFDEINTNYKTVKEQLDKILADQVKADEEGKKKQGKFEELYNTAKTDLDGFKSKAEQNEGRVKELESLFGTMLEAKLESIPEEMRELIPENLTPEAKLAWIEKAQAKGLFGTANAKKPDEPVGGSTNPPANAGTVDVSTLSPFQLLQSGYGAK